MWPLSASGVAKKPVLEAAYGNQSHVPYAVGGMFVGLFASVAVNTLSNRSRPQVSVAKSQRSGVKPENRGGVSNVEFDAYYIRFKETKVKLTWVSSLQEIFDSINSMYQVDLRSGISQPDCKSDCEAMAKHLECPVVLYTNNNTNEPFVSNIYTPMVMHLGAKINIILDKGDDGKIIGFARMIDEIIHYSDREWNWRDMALRFQINKPPTDIQAAARIAYP